MMKSVEITEQMMRYRECARHVWNAYFRGIAFDAEHDFINVNDDLFFGIVLAEFGPVSGKRHPDGYYPEIRVSHTVPPKGLPILYPIRTSDANIWTEGKLRDPKSDLRFMRFFDWDTIDDAIREFKFVQVRAIEVPDNPGWAGLDLLIEPEHLRFHHVRDVPHGA